MKKEVKKLYPVKINGRWWTENQCSSLFVCFYTGENSLLPDGCVYAYDGMYVFPDGMIVDFSED